MAIAKGKDPLVDNAVSPSSSSLPMAAIIPKAIGNLDENGKKEGNGAVSRVSITGTTYCHPQTRVAILSQHHFDEVLAFAEVSVIDYIAQRSLEVTGSTMQQLELRALLGKFGLSGDVVFQPIASLSGHQL